MTKPSTTLVLSALCALALAACGGDDGDGESEPATSDPNPKTDSVEVSAVPDGSFAYKQDSIETEPGELTVAFSNPAPIAHDFCVESPNGSELGCSSLVADGDSTTEVFDLEAGEYTFFCSVAGHREGGMEGKLVVE